MPWRGPEAPGEFPTLGYQVAALIEERCVIPDGDLQGQPFKLTDEQYWFLLCFYRIQPNTERFAFRRASLIRSQKWGKGPFSAAIVCAEVDPDGPVRFAGWDARGEPVGRSWPTPWVQVTAYSLDQTANVWRALVPMIQLGPLQADIPDTGETRINLPGGGRIEPVTSSHGSRLGQRITLAVQDETQNWLAANGMLKVGDTQLRNLAGMGGRSIETTNAPDPNEDSVATRTLTAAGKVKDIHVDFTPSPPGDFADPAVRRVVLQKVYGDSWWVDLERINADCEELIAKGDLSQAERFFGNRQVATSQHAFDLAKFDAGRQSGPLPAAKTSIAVGFDGSESRDSTALWGCEMLSGRLFRIGLWERPEGSAGDGWTVPEVEVDQALRDAAKYWRVELALCDPRGWRTWIKEWAGSFGDKVIAEFPTNSWTRMREAVDGFASAMYAEPNALPHDGDLALRLHVGHCRRQLVSAQRPEAGWVVVKDGPNSPRKIDAAVAAILARWARGLKIADGWKPRGRSRVINLNALAAKQAAAQR